MIDVFYRKERGWGYPQIKFSEEYEDYVVTPDNISDYMHRWEGLGLTQATLANGYDNSVCEIHIARQKR